MPASMRIGGRAIGAGHAPYVIAEIGVNHDGDPERALALVDAAAEAGADAVKTQHFRTDLLLSRAARLAAYQRASGEQDPAAMLRRLELGIDGIASVAARARERGMHAIVTTFSIDLVDDLSGIGLDAAKVASPDIINRPLLEALAGAGLAMIVSTGASTIEEVERASGWLAGVERASFLQCVSSYPAPENGLDAIGAIARATGRVVGYSDHTPSVETGGEGVARGAAILEKHLTLDRSMAGPDHAASLEPEWFARYVRLARARGVVPESAPARREAKRVLECERDVRVASRQSLVSTRDLRAGHRIERADLAIKRPGTGLEPFRCAETIGRRLGRAIEADMPINEDDLEHG